MKITPIPFSIISHTALRLAGGLRFPVISLFKQSAEITNSSALFDAPGDGMLGTNIDNSTGALSSVVEVRKTVQLPDSLKVSAADGLDASIGNFLGKPYIAAHGNFASTDVATTFNFIDCNVALLNSETHNAKIKGLVGLRFTTVITLQVNGTKFQQGLYALCFIPTAGAAHGSVQTNNWLLAHCYSKTQITQLVHTIIDINCDTEVQLRIPWQSAWNSWIVVGTQSSVPTVTYSSPGFFFLYPYDPLVAVGGSTTASYVLKVHYEDVEVLGNTVSQMSNRRGNPMSAETKNKPISGGLKIASEAVGLLSRIPLLSSVAGPASWFLDMASSAAWAFGFSKPQVVTAPSRIVRELAPYFTNTDAPDSSTVLGYSCNNQIRTFAASSTDLDEMSFDFIKGIPSWYRKDNWSTVSAYGTQIAQILLTPNTFFTNISDGSNTFYSLTPICLLASAFTYYSGGITLTFRFCRTQFHSGRLAVVFTPYEEGYPTPAVTVADLPYSHHHILDIRESNIATITFPYVNNAAWRISGDQSDAYGLVTILVIDPLVAPANVSGTITINYEASGAPDLQFAVPNQNVHLMRPVVPLIRQSGNPCSMTDDVVGGTSLKVENLGLTELCIGESIHSVRTLLKRGEFMSNASFSGSNNYLQMRPFDTWWNVSLTGGVLQGSVNYYGAFNIFTSCYAFQRGSVRVRIMPTQTTNNNIVYLSQCFDDNTALTPRTTPVFFAVETFAYFLWACLGSAFHVVHSQTEAAAVTVPHYYQLHSKPTILNTQYGTTPNLSITQPFADTQYLLGYANGTLDPVVVHRAAGDDYSLHGFVSVPPVYIQFSN